MEQSTPPTHSCNRVLPQPQVFLSDGFIDVNGEVIEGLSTCIMRMTPKLEVRDLIISKLQNYKQTRGRLFSLPLAI